MLRSPQLRKQITQSYICWQCRAKLQPTSAFAANRQVLLRNGLAATSPRYLSSGNRARAEIETQSSPEVTPEFLPVESPPPARPPLRERLRIWEAENAPLWKTITDGDFDGVQTSVSNTATRPQAEDFKVEVENYDEEFISIPQHDRGDLVEVGHQRTFLLTGDLVELVSVGGSQQELAIYIREIGRQAQFYTMSGRWMHKSKGNPKFFVPGFVEAHELDAIRPYLPDKVVPVESEDTLHSFPEALPRNIGQPLISKMLEFWVQTEVEYQKASGRFDNAHQLVASKKRMTYATLKEIADRVLTDFVPKNEEGNFSATTLYALHRSLMRDDIGFQCHRAGTMRTGGEYEILSQQEVAAADLITTAVQEYRDAHVKGSPDINNNSLAKFARKARNLIDSSRANREFTPYGMIGPWKGSSRGSSYKSYKDGRVVGNLTVLDHPYVSFLESFAGLKSFNVNSPLNGIASTILRAIGRYRDVPLDAKTAWTALQEMGIIPPWENLASYELRLPHTGRRLHRGLNTGAFQRKEHVAREEISGFKEDDSLEALRKDWGDLPVYCIDDKSAKEIDDGISLERTDKADEFWIHVHAADPASHLDPQGLVAFSAELMIQSIYLPDRNDSMLPNNFVQENLSLAPGKRCLTFSARMNLSGEILEHKVTPGIVRNVLFITHEAVKQLATGTPKDQGTIYAIGPEVPETVPSRPVLDISQLSDACKMDFEILEKIKMGRWKILLDRGAQNMGLPTSALTVSFGSYPDQPVHPQSRFSVPLADAAGRGSKILRFDGDPSIKIFVEDSALEKVGELPYPDFVSCFMLAAAEVAAKWCNDRGIPVPYRVTPLNPDKEHPLEYFNRVYQPAREKGPVPLDIQTEYMNLIPSIQPSTTAGPHIATGMDMMLRCTSPLRRFSDLLVHWQIEAALLEENRLGHSLVGNTKDDFLPFSKERVEALLPRLANREKLIKLAQNQSQKQWTIEFLLRAWHFKEAELPSPLIYKVMTVNLRRLNVGGILPAFLIRAQMDIPDDVGLDEIKPDDVFEVEIKDIDVHGQQVYVKMVRRVKV